MRLDAENWRAANGRVYQKTRRGYVHNPDYDPDDGRVRKPLTEDDASYIKGQLAAGASKSWLAAKFKVSVNNIHLIATGRNWKSARTPHARLEGPPKGAHRSRWVEHLPYDEEVSFEGSRSGRKSYTVARG